MLDGKLLPPSPITTTHTPPHPAMMPPRTLGALCPLCHISLRPQGPSSIRPLLQTWQAQSYATKEKPSRMVLSDRKHVARGDKKPPRRSFEGPFGSMNTTYFNPPPTTSRRGAAAPRHERTTSRSSDRTGGGRSTSKFEKGDREDFKTLKMHRALADVSYKRRNQIKDAMQSFEAFDQFELLPSVKKALLNDALQGMIEVKPTPVQRLAIPALLGQQSRFSSRSTRGATPARQEFLLAAETGSGKTLAYLIPAINALKTAEEANPDIQSYKQRLAEERENQKSRVVKGKFDEPHPTMARPRVVILVPSAELVDQVGAVAKTLSHEVKFKSEKLSAKLSAEVIERNLYSSRGVDVVISTPQLLAGIAESDPNILSQVTDLIIDEADSLFDRSFAPVTTTIVSKALPSVQRLVCCSATIPRGLDKYLAREFPDMVRITTPNLHAVPRRVQLGVIDVSKDPYRDNKDLATADAIYSIGRESSRHEGLEKDEIDIRRIIVFVNERETVQTVAEYLQSKGIDAIALHRDTSEQRQSAMLSSFTSAEPMRGPAPPTPEPGAKRSLPNVKVIVATDLASRGIDTLAVRHVILYDVPHTTIDFIHRLGRAGRMGRRGRGIVLAGRKDRKDVIAEVKKAMFMGQALV
ncbi:ATP-dependent RNA helicase mrh-4 [Plectosphaerella plurivora]|uniref:RNA helicase n=1 Tax=Plectosphaerella plurivora TaxID=936078 RepID=A0A9P9AAY2_9PEZI|nr:ATP-dependent RNA helicase mrh-4 [Plectosphaerella plurivora]